MSQRALVWSNQLCLSGCRTGCVFSAIRRGESSHKRCKIQQPACRGNFSTQIPERDRQAHVKVVQATSDTNDQQQLGCRARKSQADRDFFVNLLSAAATNRDAKAYLSRLRSPQKLVLRKDDHAIIGGPAEKKPFRPEVNVGNFFGRARALDESPVFAQYSDVQAQPTEEIETVHVALVQLVDPEKYSNETLNGIAQTLSQLSVLSMAPCVVLDMSSNNPDPFARKTVEKQQADRLAAAIDSVHQPRARVLDSIFASSGESGTIEVSLRTLLLRPIRRGQIPLVLSVAHTRQTQKAVSVSADDVVLALTREFAGLNLKPPPEGDPHKTAEALKILQAQVALDRIIIVDEKGGIPNASGRKHVFLNLEQEYSTLQTDLSTIQDPSLQSRHRSNLTLMKNALRYLPSLSSGLITSPADAANLPKSLPDSTKLSGVGTRRQKNSLIHNLLTDKPAYSASLPSSRLGRLTDSSVSPVQWTSTFVKKGMPLTILPEPGPHGWTPPAHNHPPRLQLTDPRIDLPRLIHLIEDSFNRPLDINHYLSRISPSLAGIIIAGEYEGGALFTWETPPNSSGEIVKTVPYLDKFAVLKRSQGAGGVADILFNSMARTCLPRGVCWRSRKDNPVNRWYFERSRGTWKLPDTNWTMFWTTPGILDGDTGGDRFQEYEAVCRGVEASWADGGNVPD